MNREPEQPFILLVHRKRCCKPATSHRAAKMPLIKQRLRNSRRLVSLPYQVYLSKSLAPDRARDALHRRYSKEAGRVFNYTDYTVWQSRIQKGLQILTEAFVNLFYGPHGIWVWAWSTWPPAPIVCMMLLRFPLRADLTREWCPWYFVGPTWTPHLPSIGP